MVLPPGYDPGSSDFQSVAMTTSAKAAKKEKPRDALVRGRYRLEWCSSTESNCRLVLTMDSLYHLTTRAKNVVSPEPISGHSRDAPVSIALSLALASLQNWSG